MLDNLQALQSQWNITEQIHWHFDKLLIGSDLNCEPDFTKYKQIYEESEGGLNRELCATTS